jgi:hypothetical protein
VPPRFRLPRFADLPMRLFNMLDAERPTLFMVLVSWLLMDLLLPLRFDLPIARDIMLFMDLYVLCALFFNGVSIYN